MRPHPWLPNTYTVSFLDGRLVYAVLEGDEMGLVVVLRYEPTPDQGEQPRGQ